MNVAQTQIVGKLVTESALDFLASKHQTSARVIADLVAAGHENVTKQFLQLIALGVAEAIETVEAQ